MSVKGVYCSNHSPEQMMALYVSANKWYVETFHFTQVLNLNFMWWHCCTSGLVRFRHKRPLDYGLEKIKFYFIIPASVATKTAGNSPDVSFICGSSGVPALLTPPPSNKTIISYTCSLSVIWQILQHFLPATLRLLKCYYRALCSHFKPNSNKHLYEGILFSKHLNTP